MHLPITEIEEWGRQQLQQAALAADVAQARFEPITGDASFRRYFRVFAATGESEFLIMEAPPPQEDVKPFIAVAERLAAAGVCVPAIYAVDLTRGLLLLDDFGDDLYRQLLTAETADQCMAEIVPVLGQLAREVDVSGLAEYDRELMQREMDEFPEWFLAKHTQQPFNESEQALWQQFSACLLEEVLHQPQSFVHRDFMSSNLLRTVEGDVGVIDFQDAVHGPVTYDLASLLWDRYLSWPREQVEAWIEQARLEIGVDVDPLIWRRWCDWTGLQRNLKIIGRFSRLCYRDNKPAYLELMPRFIGFVKETLALYPEFARYRPLLESRL